MADEEQFSLCWNNFNSNLSAGFHESLCRGDLVDVTLAAEGHLVKAHRLVLSVCSPYFRKMFTQMPANQHAFVFLKDVSHAALKDLIQFMYCGEVNVKQDALPTFISTAEALQIKGLTETGEAAATPASAQSPAKVPTPAPSTTSTIAATSPRTRGIQRNISRTSYKIDSEDSSDDKPIVPVPQKRIVQRSLTPVTALPPMKRIKTVDPLEEAEQQQAQQQQQQQQQQHQHHHHTQLISAVESKSSDEPEFIDLPIETIPTKAEPDYGEDGGDVEAVEQDVSYVEDDSYGDMKYDESYFTENDEAKPGASGFTETAYPDGGGEQSTNEAQETEMYVIKSQKDMKSRKKNSKHTKHKLLTHSDPGIIYEMSQRGNKLLHFDGHKYIKNNVYGHNVYWKCTKWHGGCKARAITNLYDGSVCSTRNVHNHQYVFESAETVSPKDDKKSKIDYFGF